MVLFIYFYLSPNNPSLSADVPTFTPEYSLFLGHFLLFKKQNSFYQLLSYSQEVNTLDQCAYLIWYGCSFHPNMARPRDLCFLSVSRGDARDLVLAKYVTTVGQSHFN